MNLIKQICEQFEQAGAAKLIVGITQVVPQHVLTSGNFQ
jgi:hypothetical protein